MVKPIEWRTAKPALRVVERRFEWTNEICFGLNISLEIINVKKGGRDIADMPS